METIFLYSNSKGISLDMISLLLRACDYEATGEENEEIIVSSYAIPCEESSKLGLKIKDRIFWNWKIEFDLLSFRYGGMTVQSNQSQNPEYVPGLILFKNKEVFGMILAHTDGWNLRQINGFASLGLKWYHAIWQAYQNISVERIASLEIENAQLRDTLGVVQKELENIVSEQVEYLNSTKKRRLKIRIRQYSQNKLSRGSGRITA